MEYTPEQYAMLERFEKGLNIEGMEEEELRVYWFLIDQGLLQPRADIEDGLHFLSEKGKIALFRYHDALSKAEEQARNASEKEAKEEKQQRFNNKIAIANLLISLVSFFVGLSVEFYVGIYARVVEWWPKLASWLSGLFH